MHAFYITQGVWCNLNHSGGLVLLLNNSRGFYAVYSGKLLLIVLLYSVNRLCFGCSLKFSLRYICVIILHCLIGHSIASDLLQFYELFVDRLLSIAISVADSALVCDYHSVCYVDHLFRVMFIWY